VAGLVVGASGGLKKLRDEIVRGIRVGCWWQEGKKKQGG